MALNRHLLKYLEYLLNILFYIYVSIPPCSSDDKESVCSQETQVPPLGWEDPLENVTTSNSSILAGRIPWTWTLAVYSAFGRKESDTTG